ncbi:MAG: hypothetical protein GY713_23045 [Actinomycetia bacterium]|nr:hypothetical protein [Actinomycetes bacterium]
MADHELVDRWWVVDGTDGVVGTQVPVIVVSAGRIDEPVPGAQLGISYPIRGGPRERALFHGQPIVQCPQPGTDGVHRDLRLLPPSLGAHREREPPELVLPDGNDVLAGKK